MTRKRIGNFVFETYSRDHRPYHVHVYDKDFRFLGRYDIENQEPMDNLKITVKLRKALKQAGFMKEES